MFPVRPHGTDFDFVGKRQKKICWVLFQTKQCAEFDENKWCRPHLPYPDLNAQAETSGALLSAMASITRRHGLDRIGKYVFVAGIDIIYYIIII